MTHPPENEDKSGTARTQPLLFSSFPPYTIQHRDYPILTLFPLFLLTVIADYRRKLLLSRLIRNAKLSLMLYETWNKSKHK